MQSKTTRAFRTISEAGEELDLQPHVLRFWESKFSQIKPIKRAGGRRFYRPEDIELLRGIKILLHDEGHPIKDVQKLIRLKGAARIIELGQSVEKAARDKSVEETDLVPERIKKKSKKKISAESTEVKIVASAPQAPKTENIPTVSVVPTKVPPVSIIPKSVVPTPTGPTPEQLQYKQDLEEALERLKTLKTRWTDFTSKA
jgi:DNA-binding transcriptional MerR regulator